MSARFIGDEKKSHAISMDMFSFCVLCSFCAFNLIPFFLKLI